MSDNPESQPGANRERMTSQAKAEMCGMTRVATHDLDRRLLRSAAVKGATSSTSGKSKRSRERGSRGALPGRIFGHG